MKIKLQRRRRTIIYYSYIWFDLGMTLVGNNRAENYKNTLAQFGISKSVQEIEIAYHMADKLFMREYRGILGKNEKIFLPWYLGVLNYNLRVELDLNKVSQVSREIRNSEKRIWKAFSYSRTIISEIKSRGVKVGLISNWDTSCRKVLEDNRLLELLDTIVVSSEVNLLKPSKEIFSYAVQKSKANPDTSLYVGDNYYDDVIGASKVGMPCLLINPYGNAGIQELNYPYVIKDIREVVQYLEKPCDEMKLC